MGDVAIDVVDAGRHYIVRGSLRGYWASEIVYRTSDLEAEALAIEIAKRDIERRLMSVVPIQRYNPYDFQAPPISTGRTSDFYPEVAESASEVAARYGINPTFQSAWDNYVDWGRPPQAKELETDPEILAWAEYDQQEDE